MKLHLADINQTPKSVFLNGYTIRKANDKYTKEFASVRLSNESWNAYLKKVNNKINMPIVLDIAFSKGVGAYIKL